MPRPYSLPRSKPPLQLLEQPHCQRVAVLPCRQQGFQVPPRPRRIITASRRDLESEDAPTGNVGVGPAPQLHCVGQVWHGGAVPKRAVRPCVVPLGLEITVLRARPSYPQALGRHQDHQSRDDLLRAGQDLRHSRQWQRPEVRTGSGGRAGDCANGECEDQNGERGMRSAESRFRISSAPHSTQCS